MATILLEDFETDGNTLNGGDRYTTSIAEFVAGSAGNDDYFTRTDDISPSVSGTYLGASGSYFAVADTNGSSNALDTQTLTFAAVDISGFSNLSISGLFAEDTASNNQEDWDGNTQVFIEVSIDGGAFDKVLQFASLGTAGNSNNDAPGQDTDLDGIADAADLTDTFTSFTGAIAATGSTMTIRIVFENLQAGDEDIALDNIQLTGDGPIIGTDANDSLAGTTNADSIFGGDGSDLILADAGNDLIEGGAGIDAINAGEGDDTIFGNDGNDILVGAGGSDVMYGGLNDDLLLGGADADQLFGGAGIDTGFYANSVTASLADASANTEDAAGDSYDAIENLKGAAGGAYIFTGNDAQNTLTGADQNDQLFGGAASDTLNGGAGDDTMDGGAGNDRFIVDSTGDVLIEATDGGYDRADVSASVTLGDNVEQATAQGTDDLNITGNASNNWLNGNTGANTLDGEEGNDRLQGGDGADVLIGGTGNDNLFGQAGIDTFVFNDGDGVDVIRDFETGETIDLSGTSADSFDALVLKDVASGAFIDYGAGIIVLSGLASTDLSEADFQF
ncbi:MAG: calcium-binding protein [Pseudomonadota bacterium]